MSDMLLALKVLRKLGPKVMKDHDKEGEKSYYIYPYSNAREQGIAIIHDKGEKVDYDKGGIFGNCKVVIFSEQRNSDSLQVMVGKVFECNYHDFWKHAFSSGSEEMYKNSKYFEPSVIMTKGVNFIKKELKI